MKEKLRKVVLPNDERAGERRKACLCSLRTEEKQRRTKAINVRSKHGLHYLI